jgi:tRNA modification GTPase
VVALQQALDYLVLAKARLPNSEEWELVAEDLRQAQGVLGTITGVVTTDDLLGEIFSSFCIGK